MSEEEKKAIKSLKGTYWLVGEENIEENVNIILKLIDNQQKEIEELKERNENLTEAIEEWVNGERIDDIHHISKDKIREIFKKYAKDIKDLLEE